jgi:hypothetical protein
MIVVSGTMASVPTLDFQNLWSNLTESLRLEYKNTVQHADTDAVMVYVREVLNPIAHLAGCTPASVSKVQNGL